MTHEFRRLEVKGADENALIGNVIGEGRPVLLLHGGGQTRHAWDQTARTLAQYGFQAFAFDMRGHGESQWVKKAGYSFPEYARDAAVLADWLIAETGGRPIGIGASLGGLSLIGAEDDRARFAAIALVDIVPRMKQEGAARIVTFMTAAMESGFATLEDAAAAIQAYLPKRNRPKSLKGLQKNMRQHEDGRWRWHWDPEFASGSERSVMADSAEHLLRFDKALERLTPPVLLVRGMTSDLVGLEEVQDAAHRLPNGRYVDIAEAGHMIVGDKNDAFTAALLSFLSDLPDER